MVIDDSRRHYYEPGRGHGLAHDPLNSIVAPRPIGWMSTHDGAGGFNLAPYSFFNLFSYRPPIIGFASSGEKDTLRNALRTREFVWNLVTEPLAQAMNATSAPVAPGVDEFALARLTPLPSRRVGAPRVAESPVNFECRVTQVVQLQDAQQQPVSSWLVLGEVVAVHICKDLLVDGVFATAAARPLMRGGGPADYFRIGPASLLRMDRPG
jgi:flavin reductase (DIM6/NTAB) family NADH-FMN oxidoreductase RutF